MKLTTAVKRTLEYLTCENGLVGSVLREVKQPLISDKEFIADLHCHPYINNVEDLIDTVRVCKRNNVGLCAIIQHYDSANPHNSHDIDYWDVLKIAEENNLPIEKYDGGLSFELENVRFIGGYEFYGYLKGLKGKAHLDLVPIMPEKGLIENIKEGQNVKDLIKICKDYNSIVIGAHPYTLWDPWFFGKAPFRIADKDERELMQSDFFGMVDTVDCPASNAFWMMESNKMVKEDFDNPIYTSDTHSKSKRVRRELGRAGIVLHENILKNNLRKSLYLSIAFGNFGFYEGYMPALQFIEGIAL